MLPLIITRKFIFPKDYISINYQNKCESHFNKRVGMETHSIRKPKIKRNKKVRFRYYCINIIFMSIIGKMLKLFVEIIIIIINRKLIYRAFFF